MSTTAPDQVWSDGKFYFHRNCGDMTEGDVEYRLVDCPDDPSLMCESCNVPVIRPGPPEKAPAPTTGRELPCPCCGEECATIFVSLADPDQFECQDCSTSFTADEVKNFIKVWSETLAWLKTMPPAGVVPKPGG